MPLRRIRPLLVGLLTALAVAGAGAPASAAPATGSVVGHVVDSAGAAVPDFAVLLATADSESTTRHAYRVRTDTSGAFAFTGVAPGRYLLLNEEPTWFFADPDEVAVSTSAGSTATVRDMTVVRAATVHGTVVSSADGSPVAGQLVSAAGPSATTDADGAFTIAVRPGAVTVRTGLRFWFDTARATYTREGEVSDLGTIALDPAGLASTTFLTAGGRAIRNRYEAAVVDGCRVTNLQESACPGVALYATVSTLQLKPGRHTIRYEVRSPLGSSVRRFTRTVDVRAGQEVAVPRILVPTVDPAKRAVIEPGTYRRGHRVVIRVTEGSYVDGGKPRLPVTIRVGGRVVEPVRLQWRTRANGTDVLVATLPARLSTRPSLKVRAVVHGRSVYRGQTSAAVRLARAE